jgi:enoyl-[acyl-carrier-protein] reductase (NADH)
MSLIKNILGMGKGDLLKSLESILDQVITNKEELAKVKIEAEKEVNRHLEALADKVLKQQELEVDDRKTARQREAEVVKAIGHFDYMMWALAFAGIGILFYSLYQLVNTQIQNKELFVHLIGIIEGVVVSIYSYYFGSSLGSRIKDMK